MGINLSIPITALNTTQSAMNVNSANVANAQNPDHSRQTIEINADIAGGRTTGVKIAAIERQFNVHLQRNFLDRNADLGSREVMEQTLQDVQRFFGSFGGKSSIAHHMTDFFKKLEALSESPTDPNACRDIILAANNITESLAEFGDGIQDLRKSAEESISDSVKNINDLLNQLALNNAEITRNKGLGRSTASFEDMRDGLLKKLSSFIPVQHDEMSLGGSYIQTPNGIPLVVTKARPLSFDKASNMGPNMTYAGGTLAGVLDMDGKDITKEIKSGQLQANIKLRDETLPKIQEKLDEIALQVRDMFNALHNKGSSYPPQGTLVGERAFASQDTTAFTGTGTLRVAVLNKADNKVVNYADIDLTTVSTLGQLRTAIATSGATASYTSDNKLQIDSGNTNYGVALTSIGSTDAKETSTGAGVSHYFGFNDLFTTPGLLVGGSRTGAANIIQVRDSILKKDGVNFIMAPGKIARAELTKDTITLGTTEGLAAGNADVIKSMVTLRTSNVLFNDAGDLTSTSTTFENYASIFVGSEASNAANARATLKQSEASFEIAKKDLSSYSGVNLEQELIDMQQNAIAHNASIAAFSIIRDAASQISSLVRV